MLQRPNQTKINCKFYLINQLRNIHYSYDVIMKYWE